MKKPIILVIILCLFHFITNIFWSLSFEPSLELIYPGKKIDSFSLEAPTYLPLLSESHVIDNYKVSLFLLPLVRYIPQHFSFINNLLFICLIIVIFLIGKKISNPQIGVISAFIISFSPCIYLLSRQVRFYIGEILIISLIILFLLYSNYFSRFSFSILAALLFTSLKYFCPTTETTLAYLVLSGPTLYFFIGMTKNLRKYPDNKTFLKTLKKLFIFLIFATIIGYDFKTFCIKHIFSDYVAQECQKFSAAEAWSKILKKENKAKLLIKLASKSFLTIEMLKTDKSSSLIKAAENINLPRITTLSLQLPAAIPPKGQAYWKYLLLYLPPSINNKRIYSPPEGQDTIFKDKIHSSQVRVLYGQKPQQLITVDIYLNSPQIANIYSALEKQGERENEIFLNRKIKIQGTDVLSSPLTALSSYWVILAVSLLKPFIFCSFLMFFVFYFKKSFPGKLLFLLWILPPVITLSFITKKIDHYLLGTIPAFSLLLGNYLYFSLEKIDKRTIKKFILLCCAFPLVMDFFCSSFFPKKFSFYLKLPEYFYTRNILKTFEGRIETRYDFKRNNKQKAGRILSQIVSNYQNNTEKINIFNDYELFKQLSFYALFSKKIGSAFYFIKDDEKANIDYEIIYKKPKAKHNNQAA